jgi:hypothetical protein
MSGQIFISRRDNASYPAGHLYDRFSTHFPQNLIFRDVDNLDPGVDFVEAIETRVCSCDVLIAVIGKRRLISSDEEEKRRLDKPDDFMSLEIAIALERNIRVIPVMGHGIIMSLLSEKAQTAGSSSGFPVGGKACFYALEVIAFYCDSSGRLR